MFLPNDPPTDSDWSILASWPCDWLKVPVLLAAPSNLPIQVLILPGLLASAAPCAPVELNYFDGITTQMMPLV